MPSWVKGIFAYTVLIIVHKPVMCVKGCSYIECSVSIIFYAYILVSYVTCYLQCHCCPVAQAQIQSPATVTVHILLHAPTLSVTVVFKVISIVIIVSDDH